MIVIVDSGATKSTWVVMNSAGKVVNRMDMAGINPTANIDSLTDLSESSFSELVDLATVSELHFYGAGTSNNKAKNALKHKLDALFISARITIETDILGAARAVSDSKESIVAILGTGMNKVHFDGVVIKKSFTSLGYLLGDTGSGYDIGRKVLQSYYHNKMNKADALLFQKTYSSDDDQFIFNLHQSDKPNSKIASFSRFLNFSSSDLKLNICKEVFSKFFDECNDGLLRYNSYNYTFVGSISKFFESELREAAYDHKIEIDIVMADPIDGLIDYHKKLLKLKK